MTSCRCSCKAYGGACDCRFDGLTAGRQRGEEETVAAIVKWLRSLALGDGSPWTDLEIADALTRGDWK